MKTWSVCILSTMNSYVFCCVACCLDAVEVCSVTATWIYLLAEGYIPSDCLALFLSLICRLSVFMHKKTTTRSQLGWVALNYHPVWLYIFGGVWFWQFMHAFAVQIFAFRLILLVRNWIFMIFYFCRKDNIDTMTYTLLQNSKFKAYVYSQFWASNSYTFKTN
jgi:hypothetical protein